MTTTQIHEHFSVSCRGHHNTQLKTLAQALSCADDLACTHPAFNIYVWGVLGDTKRLLHTVYGNDIESNP